MAYVYMHFIWGIPPIAWSAHCKVIIFGYRVLSAVCTAKFLYLQVLLALYCGGLNIYARFLIVAIERGSANGSVEPLTDEIC